VEPSGASPSLEAELASIAEATEPGRTARIAVRHWGWDGRGGATLEATGREFQGITRERVRQLCERLARRLAEPDAPASVAPALDAALVLAAQTTPTTAHALARLLADEHVAARPFDPAGLLTAAAVLGRDPTFTFDVVKGMRVALPSPPDPSEDPRDVIAAIVDTAHAVVRRAGAARVSDITGRVAASLGVWVEDELVTAVVSAPDDFAWLERRSGWFYLPSVAKNSVVSRVLKVLSVAGRIGLGELHAGIRRDERMKDFVMPEYILAELCERIPDVAVRGDIVALLRPVAPDDVLETTELTLVRVLREHGGPMERRELESACAAAGMKASSFNNRIAYSPIIAERGRGLFGLRDGRAARGDEDAWQESPRTGGIDASRTGHRR